VISSDNRTTGTTRTTTMDDEIDQLPKNLPGQQLEHLLLAPRG
jgi:hypothetical protein